VLIREESRQLLLGPFRAGLFSRGPGVWHDWQPSDIWCVSHLFSPKALGHVRPSWVRRIDRPLRKTATRGGRYRGSPPDQLHPTIFVRRTAEEAAVVGAFTSSGGKAWRALVARWRPDKFNAPLT